MVRLREIDEAPIPVEWTPRPSRKFETDEELADYFKSADFPSDFKWRDKGRIDVWMNLRKFYGPMEGACNLRFGPTRDREFLVVCDILFSLLDLENTDLDAIRKHAKKQITILTKVLDDLKDLDLDLYTRGLQTSEIALDKIRSDLNELRLEQEKNLLPLGGQGKTSFAGFKSTAIAQIFELVQRPGVIEEGRPFPDKLDVFQCWLPPEKPIGKDRASEFVAELFEYSGLPESLRPTSYAVLQSVRRSSENQ